MLERGSTLRTVQGPAAGVAAQAALLTALAATVGLSTAGLLVGAACGLTMDAVLAWLRPDADPVFVLLPIAVYRQVGDRWGLPPVATP